MTQARPLLLAAAAAIGLAAPARADINYIQNTPFHAPGYSDEGHSRNSFTIDMVRAAKGGTLVLAEDAAGQPGRIIGKADLYPGANPDVKFDMTGVRSRYVFATLYDPSGAFILQKRLLVP